MNYYFTLCFLLLLAILKCSCQRYFRQEQLDGNMCGNSRTWISLIMQTTNKYEIPLSETAQAIVIEKRFNASQIKRLKSDCKFQIDTKLFGKNAGIYVNILKLKMRHTPTGACIDSLIIKFNEKIKKQYCRPLEAGEIKSIEDSSGRVKITVSIDKSVPFSDPEDYVEFQIVATAFKDCYDLNREFNCKKNVKKSCISNKFVNDSIINCIEPYCSDEKLGCHTSSAGWITEEPTSVNNLPQIFLSAITSLLITMLCCGCCVYCVFKVKRCCCPPPVETTTTRVHRRRRRNNETDTENPTSSQDASPTAPPIDKDDLPPPYDALFPDRAKPEASDT